MDLIRYWFFTSNEVIAEKLNVVRQQLAQEQRVSSRRASSGSDDMDCSVCDGWGYVVTGGRACTCWLCSGEGKEVWFID